MPVKLYRDPTADAGGAAAPAPAAPEAASQPAVYTPQSYGGSSTYRDYQDPYDDPKFRAQAQPQPPALSGNASPATADGSQGGQPVQPNPTGIVSEPSASSTAEEGQVQPATEAPKGALSVEDKAFWETKDPAYKDLPDHPAVAKLARSARELETSYTRGQQYLSEVNQRIDDFRTVLAAGDPAEIAKMVEYFGGEVQFDVRKPDDVIGEIQTGYSDLVKVFQAIAPELDQSALNAVNRALEAYGQQLTGKINGIKDTQARREDIRKEIARITGVQQPKIGNPNERYKVPAQAHITQLEREAQDPNFWKYYEAIRDAFAAPDPKSGKPGGFLHAQGITAGKAFGSSIESARYYLDLGKALWIQKNMPTVLSQHEQAWLKKQQGNGAVAPPPKGAGAVTAPRTTDTVLTSHEKAMEEHMRRRSGARVETMATATFAAAPRLAGSASSLWVPSVLKNRHIFTRDQFKFINLLGSPEVQGDDQGMGNSTIKAAGGGLIRSEVDYSMNPKSYDFNKLPTSFTGTAATSQPTVAGASFQITFSNVNGLKKYHLIKNRATKQVAQVNSVASLVATVYPVAGGANGDGLDAYSATDTWDLMGSAYPDAATVGNGFRQDPAVNQNWMQFHVNEVSKGILADKLKLFPMQDNSFESDRMSAQISHNQARELAMLFGVAPSTGSITIGGEQMYLMNGLEGLSSLSLDVGGNVTWDELKLVIMPYIQQAGGGDAHLFGGNSVMSSIFGFTEDKLITNMDEKIFGVKTKGLTTPMGDLVLHMSQPFQQQEGRAVAFKPENLVRRFLPNLDAVYMKGLANNNVLQDTEAWLTCETLLAQNPDSIVWLTNWLN